MARVCRTCWGCNGKVRAGPNHEMNKEAKETASNIAMSHASYEQIERANVQRIKCGIIESVLFTSQS